MKSLLFGLIMAISTHAYAYDVYEGCEQPSTTFTRDIYVDSVNGLDSNDGSQAKPWKTIKAGSIKGGDHVHILAGTYDGILFNEYKTKNLLNNTAWVWLDFQSGAVIKGITIGSKMERFLVTGARSTSSISTGGSQLVLSGLSLGKQVDPATLTDAQWTSLPGGVSVRNGQCIAVLDSVMKVVSSGFTASSDNAVYPANSLKVLFQGNLIEDVVNDATRGIGSDITIKNNKVYRGHVKDANHDDMFQGFALDGKVFQNLLIEGNTFMDKLRDDEPKHAEYQGICIFDGLYKNVIVRKNIVYAGAYHGISLYWTENAIIENNTVVGNYPGRGLWVGFFNGKGGQPPVNAIMRNNIAASFKTVSGVTSTNNLYYKNAVDTFEKFDPANGVFDFHIKPTSSLYCKGAGAL